MRRILPIVMASAALLAAGWSSNSRPGFYAGTDRTAIAVIKWSAPQNGRARGVIIDDTLSGTPPSQTVTVQTVPVTVRFNGRHVTFDGADISALGAPTITGTLSGGRLSIRAPDAGRYLESAVLRSATPAVYNSDLIKLRQRVSHANTAANRTQGQHSAQVTSDQQQVSSDISTLQTDAGQLSSDLTQMGTDEQQVSTDFAQFQSDAANGTGPSCENVSTVDNDVSTVDNDGMTVGNDSTTITSDISTVQSDISQLTSDVETLLKDGGSAVGNPSPQTAISQAQTDVSNALTQANSYIATVNGYLQQAYTTANNLSASACD